MYAAIRAVHLTPGIRTGLAKPWPRLPHVVEIARSFGSWVFCRLATAASIVLIIYGVETLGMYKHEGEKMQSEAAAEGARKRDRDAQDRLR
jgi:hypothetical protein